MSSQHLSLKPFNTFNLDVYAQTLVIANSASEITASWRESQNNRQPALLIGEGSNLLFLEDFKGTVIVNRIKGITILEEEGAWHLHVGAGENWHELVQLTVQKGLAGLENLALIPGCVGSAPIQNIGAYGIELKDICEYVDVLNLESSEVMRLTAEQCRFGYRDSVFKHDYMAGYVIVAVGFKLRKEWHPVITYGDLTKFDRDAVTPKQIFDAVCEMRKTKLPNPAEFGNAGSFFKNPVVASSVADLIKSDYPDAPLYPFTEGFKKLAAGWLIDRCGLKGLQVGGAAVHMQQALVLINRDNATGDDIVALARTVRQKVGEKFNVWLEPEVRFIGAQGEKDAVGVIS